MTARESKPAPAASRWAAVIVAVIIAAYSSSVFSPFVFDDQYAIVTNASVRSLAGALSPARNSPVAGRPVVALTFTLNYLAGGLDVRGYHVVNVGIHVCVALLLFGIVRRTLLMFRPTGSRAHVEPLAFAVALLWAIHPLSTEAVDYMTQRTESLMALMFMLTLYASIRATEGLRPARWVGAALAASALGMACKESMVVAPIIVVLYDRTFLTAGRPEGRPGRLPLYAGLALTWLVVVYLLLPGPRAGSTGFLTGVTPWDYALNQTEIVLRYLRLSGWPIGLVINYGRPAARTLTDVWPEACVVGLLLAGMGVALVHWPRAGFLMAWVFLTLAPTSTIVPIATEVGAERRMYLPLMAIVAGGVFAGYRLGLVMRVRSPVPAVAAIVSVAVALAITTVARHRDYASALTLAQTTLARWPSPTAHAMVGGELAALGRDVEALPELRIAADVEPRARYNLGVTLFNLTDDQGAIRELELLAREHPGREEIPAARRLLGSAYARQQKWPEAAAQYRSVLSMAPSDQEARRRLIEALANQGAAFARAGQFVDAIATLHQSLVLDRNDVFTRHTLAMALYDAGDVAGAVAEARATLEVDAGHAPSHDLVGRALAVQGRYNEAIEELEHAARLSPGDGQIQDDLRQALDARSQSRRAQPVVR